MKRLMMTGCILLGFLLIFGFTKPSRAKTLPLTAEADALSQPLATCSGGNDCWVSGMHLPGITGDIYALAKDGAKVYVGGELIRAGGLPVNNIAMWDGNRWHDMGGGVSHSTYTARVSALAVDSFGKVYVGGVFNQAGAGAEAVSVQNLALWNGSTWSSLAGGVNGSVRVIRLTDSTMLVGGGFTQAGATLVNNIALYYFQTSQWENMGGGVTWDSNFYSFVNAIECVTSDCNQLYVGGAFDKAGGVEAVHVAYASRSGANYQWQALDRGLSGGGEVNALLWRNSSLYVGGAFSSVGTSPIEAHNVAGWWNGQWHSLGYGTDGEVKALLWSDNNLIVGGDFTTAGSPAVTVNNISRWNGSTWSALGNGLGTVWYEEVNALLLDGSGHIVAGGDFEFSSSQVVNSLAKWTSDQWVAFDGGRGINNLVDNLLADGEAVYVQGSLTRFGSLATNGLAKLTNLSWSAAEGSPAPWYIYSLAKVGSTLYAGGAMSDLSHLAYWSGSAWQTFAGGTNGYVNAVAYDRGTLYVGGQFTQVGGGSKPASYFAWRNLTWETVPNDEALNGPVRSMAIDAQGNVYVGGEFTYAGNLYVNHIAMWDGSQWHALGGGLDSRYVETLTFDGDGRLYAGGYFAYAEGVQVNGIAMWNGREWAALGVGMDDGVGALVVDPYGQLYAAGDFKQAGGVPANHVARWNGFHWSALGDGTDGNIRALAITSSSTYQRLVVGGFFKTAGDKLATNIALYDLPPIEPAPAPKITSISPTQIAAGSSGFWLTVTGENFSSRTYVKWVKPGLSAFNSTASVPLVTTYLSRTQLRAYVPKDLIETEGSVTISAFTPAVEGGGGGEATNSVLPVFAVVDEIRVFLPLVIRR